MAASLRKRARMGQKTLHMELVFFGSQTNDFEDEKAHFGIYKKTTAISPQKSDLHKNELIEKQTQSHKN